MQMRALNARSKRDLPAIEELSLDSNFGRSGRTVLMVSPISLLLSRLTMSQCCCPSDEIEFTFTGYGNALPLTDSI